MSDDLMLRVVEGRTIAFPALSQNPAYSELHPLLQVILRARRANLWSFKPEFSGQRGEDYDRGIMAVYHDMEQFLRDATVRQCPPD